MAILILHCSALLTLYSTAIIAVNVESPLFVVLVVSILYLQVVKGSMLSQFPVRVSVEDSNFC